MGYILDNEDARTDSIIQTLVLRASVELRPLTAKFSDTTLP
jgi:hypothetical protein